MDKDERLWMTFPIDTHRHPKLRRISVEARWVFFEMNGEARLEDNDGVFAAEDAEFMWSPELLGELVGSHPSRPLVQRVGDTYVIREYAKHQQTKADRERLNAARSDRARNAANARWGNRDASSPNATSMQGASGVHAQTSQQSESQLQSQLPDSISTESVSLGSNAREEMTGQTQEEITQAKRTASGLGVNLDKLVMLAVQVDRDLTHQEALLLSTVILTKAKNEPKKPDSYIASVFKNNPFEVQKWIDTEVIR